MYDIIIVGTGASGLACAARILKNSPNKPNLLILDANKKAGRKLLATGNGRCNLTNENMSLEHYHGDTDKLFCLMDAYSHKSLEFFEDLGLLTGADGEGRVYPYSKQATSVLNVLMNAADCEIRYESAVKSVNKSKNIFELTLENGEKLECRILIIAGGGAASPKLSASKNCYGLCEGLGHSVTKLYPSLVPMRCDAAFLKKLVGVRCRAEVTLMNGKTPLKSEIGELQITDKAISGICIFNLSVLAAEYYDKNQNKKTSLGVKIDFMPDYSFSQCMDFIRRAANSNAKLPVSSLFDGILNNKVGLALIQKAGLNPNDKCDKLSGKSVFTLSSLVKGLLLPISGLKSFDDAQVTAGGIPLKEINLYTMESLKCKNLYLCGEILNIHGDCGGYNLHFAWMSALCAADAVCDKLGKNDKNK